MRAAVAGTFGPLHDGHRRLLGTALEVGDEGVVVGLTSDDLARSSRDREVPGFADRRAGVEAALRDLDQWGRDWEIQEIRDEHGFADDLPDLDALVVSPETYPEVEAINDDRREKGFDPLVAVVVPFVRAEGGERISSTRVVQGEIDEHGTSV